MQATVREIDQSTQFSKEPEQRSMEGKKDPDGLGKMIRELLSGSECSTTDEADIKRGSSTKAYKKRAFTDEDIEPQLELQKSFFNDNADRGEARQANKYPRRGSEGQIPACKTLKELNDMGVGIMKNKVPTEAYEEDPPNHGSKKHITDSDLEKDAMTDSPGVSDLCIISDDVAQVTKDNTIEKVSPHERGKQNQTINNQGLKRHISETDGLEDSREINASNLEDARERGGPNDSKTTQKRRTSWTAGRNLYRGNSIIAAGVNIPHHREPEIARQSSAMAKINTGRYRPVNTLDKRPDSRPEPIRLVDDHRQDSNKRRKLDPMEKNGSSEEPIDVEPDNGSRSHGVSHTGGNLPSGTLYTQKVSEYQATEAMVRPTPKSRHRRRNRCQVSINGIPGSQHHNANGGFLDQVPNSRRIKNHTSQLPDDSNDPIYDEEMDGRVPGSKSDSNFEIQIFLPNNNGFSKPSRQKPQAKADPSQSSPRLLGSHGTFETLSAQQRRGTYPQQRSSHKDSVNDDDDDDELGKSDALQVAPRVVRHTAQKPKNFGRHELYTDELSIEDRGDIMPTDFGNRDQSGSWTDYKLISLFFPSKYWVVPSPSDKPTSKNRYLRQSSNGDLALVDYEKTPVDGFNITPISVNKIHRSPDSSKVIIEKSSDCRGPPSSKVFIELKFPDDARTMAARLMLNIPLSSSKNMEAIVEASELDSKFQTARKKLVQRDEQNKTSGKKAIEQPDEIQLLKARQKMRNERDSKASEDNANQKRTRDLELQDKPAKRTKLRQNMKASSDAEIVDDGGVQMTDTQPEIEPINFYGRETDGRTRSSRRVGVTPKSFKPPPRPRTPSPERWTRSHPDWAKNWHKSIIYPQSGKRTATVDKQDVERLDEGEFLNDNLIMFYLLWLEKQRPEVARRVYIHNTFFYASLTKTAKGKKGINYEAVERWTAKIDLLDYDYIVVPVCEHTHWYVAIICNASKLIEDETEPASQPSEVIPPLPPPEEEAKIRDNKSLPSSPSLSNQPMTPADDDAQPLDGAIGTGFKDLSLKENIVNADENVENLGDKDLTEVHHDGLPRSSVEVDVDAAIVSPSVAIDLVPDSSAAKPKPNMKSKKKHAHPHRHYDPKQPRIITFDSLGTQHSITCSNLKDYMVAEIKAKKEISISPPKAIGLTARKIVTQNNYCDCGVFLLGYMEEFFTRPDKFIEEMMLDTYDGQDYDTAPDKLRAKIRHILFDLQERQVQERQETLKSKKQKSKTKKIPPEHDDKVEMTTPRPPSRTSSKSARTSPVTGPSTPNINRSPDKSPIIEASTSKRRPHIQTPPVVINIDDSQDNHESAADGEPSSSKLVNDRYIEDISSPKHRFSRKDLQSPITIESDHPLPSLGLEIRDSQESTQENQNDALLSDKAAEQLPVMVSQQPTGRGLHASVEEDDEKDITTLNDQEQISSTGFLSHLKRTARSFNPFAQKQSNSPHEFNPLSTEHRGGEIISRNLGPSTINRRAPAPRDISSSVSSPAPEFADEPFEHSNYFRRPSLPGQSLNDDDDEVTEILSARPVRRQPVSRPRTKVDRTRTDIDLTGDDKPDQMLLDGEEVIPGKAFQKHKPVSNHKTHPREGLVWHGDDTFSTSTPISKKQRRRDGETSAFGHYHAGPSSNIGHADSRKYPDQFPETGIQPLPDEDDDRPESGNALLNSVDGLVAGMLVGHGL